MKRISFMLVLMFVLSSCVGSRKKNIYKDNYGIKSEIKIYKQHWNLNENSLNLFLHIEIPINKFVFKKEVDHFFSNLNFTLAVFDEYEENQIFRDSWSEKITQFFYEDTRNINIFFSMEKNIELSPGKYKLFFNVQDEDSRKSWRVNEDLDLEGIIFLSPVLPFIDNGGMKKEVAINIDNDIDTVWLRTQIFPDDDLSNEVHYRIEHRSKEIGAGKINLSSVGFNNIYYLPIPFKTNKMGLHEIFVDYNDVIFSTLVYKKNSYGPYSTNDIDEMINIMYYLFPYDFSNSKMKDKNEEQKWNYVDLYWKKMDPTPNTLENELLLQLNKRVKYVNNNFSILMSGWRTDRGKIYIIYGPPDFSESYKDEFGNSYQKWFYQNGKKFIFIDRTLSGDYFLFRELY